MKSYLVLILANLAPLACVPSAVAQHAPFRSPAELAQMYARGESRDALDLTRWPCPATDSFHQNLAGELQRLEATPAQVQELAAAWAYARANCNDSGLSEWYRRQLAITTDTYAALMLAAAVGTSRLAEDQEALRTTVFRSDLPEEVRGEILSNVKAVSAVTKVEWLAQGIASGKTIPRAYFSNAIHNVPRIEKAKVRSVLLEAIKTAPAGPHTADAIAVLVGEASGSNDVNWRRTIAVELDAISELPNASARVKSVARQAAAGLRVQPD